MIVVGRIRVVGKELAGNSKSRRMMVASFEVQNPAYSLSDYELEENEVNWSTVGKYFSYFIFGLCLIMGLAIMIGVGMGAFQGAELTLTNLPGWLWEHSDQIYKWVGFITAGGILGPLIRSNHDTVKKGKKKDPNYDASDDYFAVLVITVIGGLAWPFTWSYLFFEWFREQFGKTEIGEE